jgi:hypothetical protein
MVVPFTHVVVPKDMPTSVDPLLKTKHSSVEPSWPTS